jgi:molybdopterin molybdotransferase
VKPGGGTLLAVESATRILVESFGPPQETETVDLDRALGRVLAEEVRADRDFPPADVSAMDGFAVRSADAAYAGAVLRVVGEVRAGEAPVPEVVAGTAVRIMTGAIVPRGADAVVMVERTSPVADGAITLREPVSRLENVRQRAGETSRGDLVLAAGRAIGPAAIAALASVGRARPVVFRRPVVSVLSTGDELVPPSAPSVADHRIRDGNAPALAALLRTLGLEPRTLDRVADDRDALAERIAAGLTGDLLLVTGGVSAGAYDLVAEAFAAAGTERLFHGVAMKPGKPLLAVRRERVIGVGLPGNPLSACTAFSVLVAPALRRRMGLARWENATIPASLEAPLEGKPGRESWHLAHLEWRGGRVVARVVPSRGSGDVLSMARANGWVVTPREGGRFPAGAEITALPWSGFPT